MPTWPVLELKKPPIRASELTEEHYKTLYYFSKNEYPSVIYGKEILYRNPPHINRELKEQKLIEEDANIKGMYKVTDLGKEILRMYPTWQSLLRRKDTKKAARTFVEVNEDLLKTIHRKG